MDKKFLPAIILLTGFFYFPAASFQGLAQTTLDPDTLAIQGAILTRNIRYGDADRFSQDSIFPAQIGDCNAAIRYIWKHAAELGLDTARFVVAGASAGGSGVKASFITLAGAGHGGPAFSDAERQQKVLAFLDEVLKRN